MKTNKLSKKFTTRNIFLCLFAVLYLSVAAVSTFHAFHFFGLANNSIMAAMLAGTFEIGGKEELQKIVDKLYQVESVLDVERTTG